MGIISELKIVVTTPLPWKFLDTSLSQQYVQFQDGLEHTPINDSGVYYVRVGVKYSTCTWYLYLSTYLSVLDVLEYLVYGNAKVLVLDQKVLGTYK